MHLGHIAAEKFSGTKFHAKPLLLLGGAPVWRWNKAAPGRGADAALERPPEPDPFRLGALATFAGAGFNQFTLEFGEPT
jgi:hypothetical protein